MVRGSCAQGTDVPSAVFAVSLLFLPMAPPGDSSFVGPVLTIDVPESPDVGERVDDPEAREEWFVRQRAYPFASFPAGAYTNAAEDYRFRREAVQHRAALRSLGRAPAVVTGSEALPSGSWSEAGPSPILDDGARTDQTFGNSSGRVSAVAIHPDRPHVILLGASRGGLWRSADSGSSWLPVGDDQDSLVIADVKFAPSNPDIAYAATGDDDLGFWGAGVLKSTDGGLTWARIDNGSTANGIPNGTVLSKLAVDPGDAGKVVVAGFRYHDGFGAVGPTSIFRTADGGLTWTPATLPIPGNVSMFKSLVIEENCPGRLWAVDYNNHIILRSQNGGADWTILETSGLPAFTLNTKLAVYHASCQGPAILYASVNSGGGLAGSPGYPGVYRSVDDGATWARPGTEAGPSGGCVVQCQRYDHELFVDPNDPSRLYMLGRDLWTSNDAGATWINRSGGYDDSNGYHGGRMHVDLHDLAFQATGAAAVVYIASDGGVWSYDVASDTFTNRNGNLAISEFVDLAVNPDTATRALGGLQDNGTILFEGSPLWNVRVQGDGGYGGWLRAGPDSGATADGVFTSTVQNEASRSIDSGRTWTSRGDWATNASFNGETAEFYAPWVGTAQDNRVWHGAESLWYCDFPETCTPTWHKQADHLAALTGSRHTSKIAIYNPAPGVNGPFYVANAFPRAFLQSPDGVIWNDRTSGLPNRYISSVVFDPTDPQVVFVTFQAFGTGHVWRSLDGGMTWQDRSSNLPNVPTNKIVVDPLDPSRTWYVAMDIGVYGTVDAGASWSVVGSNLPAVVVTDLQIGPNRTLFAATGGRSLWTIPLAGWSAPPPAVAGVDPMHLSKSASRIAITWPESGPSLAVNVYEGTLGVWYSHEPVVCGLRSSDSSNLLLEPSPASLLESLPQFPRASARQGEPNEEARPEKGRIEIVDSPSPEPRLPQPATLTCTGGLCTALISPGEGSHYYLLTASAAGGESAAGSEPGWSGPDHIAPPFYAVQRPCGGSTTADASPSTSRGTPAPAPSIGVGLDPDRARPR